MKSLLPLLESELSAQLEASGLLSVPVLPGQGDGTRPDEYVSIVASGAEHRGAAHLVNLEIRVVGPVYGTSVASLSERQQVVYEWATSDESPLKSYEANGLRIFGHSPAFLSSDLKDTRRAEILEFKVGAMIAGCPPVDATP